MATLVIDPGHGGRDPGAIGQGGTREKDLNLAIGQRVERELTSQGHTVHMTRSSDSYIALADRPRLARTHSAKAFVSIHFNASTNRSLQQTETYVRENPTDDSLLLADRNQWRVLRATHHTDGGVRTSRFAVLSHAYRDRDVTAACLQEISYLSDPAEERRLADTTYLDTIAHELAMGIHEYASGMCVPMSYTDDSLSVSPLTVPLIDITHAGQYRLAYDRLSRYGVIEPLPGRDRRRFRGQQSLKDALDGWAPRISTVEQAPAYILTGGLYVDKPGAHGQGLAIDVDGLWWSDSQKFMANQAPSNWNRYLRIEATLRKQFGVVLNYDYNRDHQDHWHCDLSMTPAWHGNQSQSKFAQRVLKEIYNEEIGIDGNWGSGSRTAAANHGFNFSQGGHWERFLDDIINQECSVAQAARW